MKPSTYLAYIGYTDDLENNCFFKLDKKFIDKDELEIKINSLISDILLKEYNYDLSKYIYNKEKENLCYKLLNIIGLKTNDILSFLSITAH